MTIKKFLSSLFGKKNIPAETFSTSKNYWIDRYKVGGNSGAGSYNQLAEFKAEVINKFIEDNNIDSVIEFGCGDGNQLKYFKFKTYLGLDISVDAIELCRKLFINDQTKTFKLASKFHDEKANLTISLDVIYHLIENDVYELYMANLFNASNQF